MVKDLYAPKYYGEFECIKGECRNSCCIGWEIDIDDAAMKKYSHLCGDVGERVRKSVFGFNNGEKNACGTDSSAHFVLTEGGRCPHLDECGLCRIITELGEEYLSDICRLHPRFFVDTKNGCEVGLGMSCEEACRIILSSDGYSEFIKIGEREGEICDFDVADYRTEVYSILSDRKMPYGERLSRIAKTFSASPGMLSDFEWRELIASLEYLDLRSASRFSRYSSDMADSTWEIMLERALAYFVFRHVSGAKSYFEFRTGLVFALFCERLLASVAHTEGIISESDFIMLARRISEEIEYSTDNTDAILAEIEFAL